MALEQRQVGDQQQSAARVAVGPALGGDRVALVGGGQAGKVGVGEGDRHRVRDVGDHQQCAAEEVAVAVEEEHPHRGDRADVGEAAHQLLVPPGAVRDRAGQQHRRDREQHGEGDRVREERPGAHRQSERVHVAGRVGGVLGDGRQVRPEEHRQDGGREGCVGPVVDVPAEPYPAQGAVIGGGRLALRRAVRQIVRETVRQVVRGARHGDPITVLEPVLPSLQQPRSPRTSRRTSMRSAMMPSTPRPRRALIRVGSSTVQT